jgi:hypothetical protein
MAAAGYPSRRDLLSAAGETAGRILRRLDGRFHLDMDNPPRPRQDGKGSPATARSGGAGRMGPSFGAACWSWVPAAGWLQMARSGWVVGRRHAAGHERQGGWASAVPGVLGGSTAQAGWTRWCLAERVCCGPACRFAHTDANAGVNSGDRAKRILARWRPAGGERVHAVRGRRTAGQPRGRPITEPILPGFPDLGQNSFYEYGAREGCPGSWTCWTSTPSR